MNPFKRNLLIGYGVSLFLLVASALASFFSIQNLLSSADLVNHTNEVIKKLDGVIMSAKDGETGQRGYLLTQDEIYLEPYRGAHEKANSRVQQLRLLITDNQDQQQDLILLKTLVDDRFRVLQAVIDSTQQGKLSASDLEYGRNLMTQLTEVVKRMSEREQAILAERTAKMNEFARLTPVLIIIASLLAIFVTVISFYRVSADFKKREALQNELQEKNREVINRIHIIENITSRIAAGNFSTRVAEQDKESLGVLAQSLDKMAESLDYSFTNLADKEWQQTGIASLNEQMIGEKDISQLAEKVLNFITEYTRIPVGVFYLTKDQENLEMASSVAITHNKVPSKIKLGEGIAGRSAQARQLLFLEDIQATSLTVDFTAGSIKPNAVLAIPVFYETKLKGVIELASLKSFTPQVIDFLKAATFNIGQAIHSARDHERLQELLAETQAQSEELQSQHSELENINAELEAQAEKLQASEEELRVQQEELQQANQELEERTRLLEEKNELILERNFEIQRKAEELEVSTRYKSEFLANMSHELRTPLNSILLLSRLLSENHEKNLNTDQVEYANVIQSSGKGLLSLIDEILDLSKIESGKMELEFSEVRLASLSDEINSMFGPLARDKGIDFKISIADNLPASLTTDKLRLDQILRNLLSNALKFTRKGSVELNIGKEKEALTFSVKDTGIGVPKEKQQTIFEAFQQADGSTRREYGGTGLGLSISRELARLLGGEIRLKSEEGKGSEFTLLLPVDGKKQAETRENTEVESAKESSADTKETPSANGKYISTTIPASLPDDREDIKPGDKVILIVEDDTAFARSLLDYTRKKGYKALVAVRGDEGIELAQRFKPLGILLDVQLPVKSGWEVMDELKNNKETRPIPVHIMSSHEVKTRSLSKGAVDFINKPVAFEKLSEMFGKIEQALSKHPRKVLIVEENPKHAQALAYFLENYNISAEIHNSVNEGVDTLNRKDVDCVILDMGVPAQHSYELLEQVKDSPGLEHLPIIVFTGRNLSHIEEKKIKQYADSIVVKTAHSYQRILDEVSLFLHLVEEAGKENGPSKYRRLGELGEVLKGKKVLVADDDVRNIFSLTKSLEKYGVEVLSAIDGKDALVQLGNHPGIDLILMDMMMPEMDGYESIRRIRQQQAYRNLPIIAVTAKAMTGDREKCINAGASDYITKPVDVDQLVSLLRVWLYNK